MVTVKPLEGTEPANVTVPPAAASTGAPDSAPMSIPRCWPPAYGLPLSNENGRATGPFAGHVHAPAGDTNPKTEATSTTKSARPNRRITTTSSD
jgi:hypothetical protein